MLTKIGHKSSVEPEWTSFRSV